MTVDLKMRALLKAKRALHAVHALMARDYQAAPDTGEVVTADVREQWHLVCDAYAAVLVAIHYPENGQDHCPHTEICTLGDGRTQCAVCLRIWEPDND